jgi:release factor glutamine methyltransferase
MIAVGDALSKGTKAIQAHGVSRTPLLDASLLLCATTGMTREQLYAKSEQLLSDEAEAVYVTLITKRCASQPIAYLLGNREFYGRTFTVTPDVLIPRPDTEVLVETTLELVDGSCGSTILDLCTGSGCIGITLAAELPHSTVTLVDLSEAALEVARINAQNLVKRPIELLHGDLYSPLEGRSFDLIATNPPYLTESWYDETEAQVKAEPKMALLGGDSDGLSIIRKIVEKAPDHLYKGGILLIECDHRQQEDVVELLFGRGFTHIGSKRDLAQLHRVVWGVWNV